MDPIIAQGFVLMVAGMSIVYVFLYVLVLAMRGIALVVPRFNHLLPDDAPKTVKTPAAVAEADDAAVAVAIAAVVARGGK